MTTNQKIRTIAHHYGYESQSRQCMEECGELAHAANKMWRVLDSDSGKVKEIIEAKHNLIKEMADVSIMIAQLQELLEVSDKRLVNEMNLKLDREIERIQKAM